jgi:hypothetical protein
MKSDIIAQLGQTDILLPSLIAEGLCANNRVKARLSVLQAAGRHARDPSGGGLRRFSARLLSNRLAKNSTA